MLKPVAGGGGGFPLAHLKKSYMSMGLNKGTHVSGGGSGYHSMAQTDKDIAIARSVASVPYHRVVKTVLHKNIGGKMQRIGRLGVVGFYTAVSMEFVHQVDYLDVNGAIVGSIKNKNIR